MIDPVIVNVVSFFILCFVAISWLSFGKRLYNQSIPTGWILISVGVYLYAMSKLFAVLQLADIMLIIELIAGVVFLSGDLLVLISISQEMFVLRNRQKEIKLVMKSLKEKYFKRRITEEDLKKMYAQLEKELAEIEAKMLLKKGTEKKE
jgi:hypothetical protein